MGDTNVQTKQLLHIVFGGELKDVTEVEFEDLSKVDFVGAFPNYKAAYDAWKNAAQHFPGVPAPEACDAQAVATTAAAVATPPPPAAAI